MSRSIMMCLVLQLAILGGAQGEYQFNPCKSDADFDSDKKMEDEAHCIGDEAMDGKPVDREKCSKHGCNPDGDDGCQCGEQAQCEAYIADGGCQYVPGDRCKWAIEPGSTCGVLVEAMFGRTVPEAAAVDKATCDMADGYKNPESSAFKEHFNWLAQLCCKSFPSTFCGDFEGIMWENFEDSSCSGTPGERVRVEVGKVTGDQECLSVNGGGGFAKLHCTATGDAGKMTVQVFFGDGDAGRPTDCNGTPMPSAELDFGEYSYEVAKKLLEGGCVKHYKDNVYAKLSKPAPASVIPANFCGPEGTGASGATSTGTAGDSASGAVQQRVLGAIVALATSIVGVLAPF